MKRKLYIILLLAVANMATYAVEYSMYKPSTNGRYSHSLGNLHRQSDAVMWSAGAIDGNAAMPNQNFKSTSTNIFSGGYSISLSPIGAVVPTSANVAQTDELSSTSGVRRVNDNPEIPFPDPIGDIPLALMIIAACTYCAIKYAQKEIPYGK